MRFGVLVLAALLAFAPVAAGAINDQYAVSGDGPAQPVQAFDDGQWLYVQLRDPMTPPAPFGPNGPLQYQMRGPYLVLPLMDRVELRLGPHRAIVTRAGQLAADGIVSITAPVGLDLRPVPQAAAPRSVATHPGSVAAQMSQEVSGEIVVEGSAGPVAERLAPAIGVPLKLTYQQAATEGAYAALSQVVSLTADGTAAGAAAALKAREACGKSGRTCSIEYRGSPRGQITVVEKN